MAPPAAIGVDDWAMRRGQRYGTIIVDLERHRPIELLADRSAETLEAWLRQQPTIEVLARDRLLDYARAATHALPKCQQVADRWHLLKNLADSLERVVNRHRLKLRVPSPSPASSAVPAPAGTPVPILRPPDYLRYGAAARHQLYRERQQLFEQMQALLTQGLSAGAIGRRLGVARNTVCAYLARGGPPPELNPRAPRRKAIDPYVPHLTERWLAGCRKANQLWREIRALGFLGGRGRVAHWVRQRRELPSPNTQPRYRADFQAPGQITPIQIDRATSIALATTRTLAWILIRSPARLSADAMVLLDKMRSLEPLRVSHDLVQAFIEMIRHRELAHLPPWLDEAIHCGLREWRAFANGLRKDLAAVEGALQSPYSNGPTEGQVNKLKLLKRQMYGRAGFDLLRARLLHPP